MLKSYIKYMYIPSMKCFIFSSRCSSLSHVWVYQRVGGLQQNRARVSTIRLFRIFRICSECSESVRNIQNLFRLFSEFLAQKLVYSEFPDFVVIETWLLEPNAAPSSLIHLALNVHVEAYWRNTPFSLNLISTFSM
jgi:hypothetical protein